VWAKLDDDLLIAQPASEATAASASDVSVAAELAKTEAELVADLLGEAEVSSLVLVFIYIYIYIYIYVYIYIYIYKKKKAHI